MLLVAPLLMLLLLSFCLPIALLLVRAVYDPTMHDALPRTTAALDASPGEGVPDDAVFAALGEDLLAAKQNDSLYSVAKDLNNLLPAARSHVLRTARELSPDKQSRRPC
jgi:putative spermidine/putrescine transport system permease protein